MATYEAEQLRSLDIMLMVMELHCRNTDHTLADAYDAFAVRHRRTMNAASARLRSSYAGGQGERAQRRALDTISTTMANRYGAGHPWMGCEELRNVVHALSVEDTRLALLIAADELLADTRPRRVAMDASLLAE